MIDLYGHLRSETLWRLFERMADGYTSGGWRYLWPYEELEPEEETEEPVELPFHFRATTYADAQRKDEAVDVRLWRTSEADKPRPRKWLSIRTASHGKQDAPTPWRLMS